ncbi:hypothetical protein B5X24_HaOG207683 [Helicoverpa armigera]|uniref:Cysteine proteinase n=1 Tax=Helicoverpa armigera TaxID=29058 RepID=A0A2W1BHH3_HELAM|nr:hypothetical protein B5X24_HaOG207683 [Helicoverpa armigera]
MNNHNNYFVIVLLLFSSCLCEIINLSNNQREKFLTGFVEHYNSLPNQIYQSNEGILRSVQQVDDITFIIVAEIKATEIRDVEAFKKLECTATVQESGDDDVTVINHVCQELVPSTTPESTEDYRDTETQVEVTEGTVTSRLVQLENEVQSDTAVTSGEQFIAIPRDQPSSPCVGCTSHVNPQAPGVSDLAALGVRHLDLHEPSVNHSLDTVIDVERQVQVVNGVRYILTLLINSNNCTDVQTENCNFPKTCKVTILVKPWIKLPNGQNHRSILANNCTEPWLYGSDGEVLPEPSGDDIQVRHHTDVQSVPNQERTLTEQELLSIQEQIIPNSEFKEPTEPTRRFDTTSNTLDVSKQHVFKVESNKQTENSVPVTESEKKEQQSFNINLDTDKKKAIDDMLDFFDFSGFKPKTETEDVISRVRRSYDDDLQVLSLAKDYHGIKNSIENARFMYEMAQVMVDYLNEMDMEVKNRAVKDVVKAEDETENLQRFVYIQARVTIPCDKVECRPTDVVTQICNGVIDSTNLNSPQILNTFCYNENKERDFREVVREVPLDDPILKNLAEEALKKIETESKSKHAMKISKIVSANTQLTSGTLTKFSVVIENINCEKSVPLLLRMNCTVLQQPGSKICEVIVHERRWLNERKISYTCTDRPVEMRISKSTSITNNVTVDDPKVVEMLQEAIQYLETQSVKNNKQKIVNINSISSQIIAGFLTKIEFVVGYTNCTDESKTRDNAFQKCEVLKDEALRLCKAQIWDRSWIMDGRQVEVSCDDVLKSNEVQSARNKRSIDSIGGSVRRSGSKDNQIDYKKLAEDALQKFMLTSANRQHYVVLKVEKASGTDSQQDHVTMKCHAEVWERPWLEPKAEFSVSCANADKRVKRHLKVPSHSMKHNSVALNYEVLDDEKNGNQKERDHVSSLRGHTEEVKDPSQPEYKILAEEALRKYELKSTVYHKVVEVKRVVTRVVSGLKYNINFNAAPTTCLLNVTSARARSCKPVADVILYCHTEIWDRPWLKRKKIDVNCYADDSEDSDIDLSSKPANANNNNSEIYLKLAEEASEKYLTTSNRKYVHKVTEILSGSEQVTNESLITIVFSLSPTTCLRNDTTKKSCNLKQPLVVFHCSAEIRNSSSLEHEKEIEVTCKKRSEEKNKNEKRDIGTRHTRQTGDDDDEIDEETTFYYADRAIQHMNDNSNSNNLHKLISIHGVQSGIQMGTVTVQMYLEVAETFCLRHNRRTDLKNCEEMNGLNHRLCLARLWPSPDDELVVRHVTVVCDDDENFESITGVNIPELLKMSIAALERPPEAKYKLVHQGEPQVIPSLDSKFPFKLNFVVATTNCSKDVNLDTNPFQCYINTEIPAKSCHSFIWLETATKYIRYISAKCTPLNRVRRSSLDLANMTIDNSDIQRMVQASLEKLEMTSLHRYKQRVLQINSYSTKITSGKVTTIDFDVGYTSCLKYEWVANITSCDFLEHLPRRRCVAQIWERLWINNGQNIEVSCVDDETPLEAHIEFESAEMANELAREALKHIEAKYPHPNKQKVVRIFSLEKQVVAGIHYKMKVEVGFTDCVALSDQTDCKLLKDQIMNRFCRVNVWVRPWTDHPPNFRVSCDFQEATTYDLYHHVQAEHLFYNFLTTYNPSYVNDYSQMQKRFEIFKQNIKKIHELNVHEKGTATYGVTRFTDLSYEEFRSTYMGLKTNLTNENQVPMKMADIPDIKVPVNFDWREYDAVTDVKDQGSCGSCWAFSVTGNIEGQWKMQSGKLVSLSEQELVDCDKMDDGCNGGLPDNAYRAIEQMGGLELESDYPYEGVDEKCAFNKTLAKVQISGAVNITKNETGMAQWLVHNGPISIGINANAMQFYMGGISHPWKMLCNPTNLDHGVLIVGYGIKDYPLFHKKLPYWIVKNSWGKSWGEQGYYRVYRGDGTCGVNQMASSAVI